MDVALALESLVPAACRGGSLTDNTREQYDALRWEDKRAKPTWEELEEAWAASLPVMERQDFKEQRRLAVAAITVELDGQVFDGNEASQNRIARAILALEDGQETPWVLHDNTVITITRDKLVAVLRLAGKRQTELWIPPEQE